MAETKAESEEESLQELTDGLQGLQNAMSDLSTQVATTGQALQDLRSSQDRFGQQLTAQLDELLSMVTKLAQSKMFTAAEMAPILQQSAESGQKQQQARGDSSLPSSSAPVAAAESGLRAAIFGEHGQKQPLHSAPFLPFYSNTPIPPPQRQHLPSKSAVPKVDDINQALAGAGANQTMSKAISTHYGVASLKILGLVSPIASAMATDGFHLPDADEDFDSLVSEQRCELMAAQTLESDLDFAFDIQLQGALAVSRASQPSYSSAKDEMAQGMQNHKLGLANLMVSSYVLIFKILNYKSTRKKLYYKPPLCIFLDGSEIPKTLHRGITNASREEEGKGEECSNSPVGESSGLSHICSAGLSEDKATLRDEHIASGVVTENLNAEDVKAVMLADSAQISGDTIHHGKDNVSGLDVSVGEKTLSEKSNHSVPQKEKSDMEVECESEAAASNEVSKNCTKEMDVVLVSGELMAIIGDGVDVLPVMKQVSPNDQMLRQSTASPLQVIQESNGKNWKDQELNETVSASQGKNDGQAINSDCGTDNEFSFSAVSVMSTNTVVEDRNGLQLKVGHKVLADMRILNLISSTFRIEQGSLTGESEAVSKYVKVVPENTDIQGKKCMVFAGTTVVNGNAICLVTQIGMNTEIGKVHSQIQEASLSEEDTPLKKKLNEFGELLSIIIGVICALVWLINVTYFLTWKYVDGWPRNFKFSFEKCTYYFEIAVALAVAAIPEGLPAVITTCMALGTRKMAQKNTLVRKLPSVETLGCTTVICSDKTGTLTTNQMAVAKLVAIGSRPGAIRDLDVEGTTYNPFDGKIHGWKNKMDANLQMIAKISAICNDAGVEQSGIHFVANGMPTEAALKFLVEKMRLPEGIGSGTHSAHEDILRCCQQWKKKN